MVGTGRIELPTSSVSRKRSPTELRACKVCQERLNRKLRMTLGRLQEQPLIDFTLIMQNTASDRFYYQFPISMSTESANRWRFTLKPNEASVEILATRNYG